MTDEVIDDDDLDYDEFAEDWDDTAELALSSDDARGRPYRVRRLIEDWQENRQLRAMDDLDSAMA